MEALNRGVRFGPLSQFLQEDSFLKLYIGYVKDLSSSLGFP